MIEFPEGKALGVSCYSGSPEQAADLVVQRALAGAGGYAVLCNVHVLVTAQRDTALRAALDGAWAAFPDGAPVAWLLRRSGWPIAQRVAGPDLMPAVLERAQPFGLSHFFYGSTPEVLDALLPRLEEAFPKAVIAGAFAPPAGAEDEPESLERIVEADPDFVWVALGAPKQERWMQRHAATLAPALILAVGAAFNFHAGAKSRAPRWMQRSGLEWLHRLVCEPRRLFVRYLATNSEFVARAALDRLRRDRR